MAGRFLQLSLYTVASLEDENPMCLGGASMFCHTSKFSSCNRSRPTYLTSEVDDQSTGIAVSLLLPMGSTGDSIIAR